MSAKVKKIKLLTYNIHKGFSATNKRTLGEIKKIIREAEADIVCLQEVVGENKTHDPVPQFEFLAEGIWKHYRYGKNAIYTKGHHGNAILSKFSFLKTENINISNHSLEQRGILYGVLKLPEAPKQRIHIMTLHLDLFAVGRRKQLEKLCHLIESQVPKNEALIVCGDFNDWREVSSKYLEKHTGLQEAHITLHQGHARTYPARFPLLCLDRIYVRGLKVLSVAKMDQSSWVRLSDHLALICELAL